MTKFKMLASAAVVAALFAVSAPAEARHVKAHEDSTMHNEYAFQKSMHGNKTVKKPFKVHKHKKAKAKKKKFKKKRAHRHGTTPNECIRPPCGMNYNH